MSPLSIYPNIEQTTSLSGVSHNDLGVWAKKLVCVIGPSGVGKSSLCEAIVAHDPSRYCIIFPTVCPDPGYSSRVSGSYSVDRDNFQKLIAQRELLYWHLTARCWYGMEKHRIRQSITSDRTGLIMFRSRGVFAMKYLMPTIKVIEMRATPGVLLERRKGRDQRLGAATAAFDTNDHDILMSNDILYEYATGIQSSNWLRITNEHDAHSLPSTIISEAWDYVNR